MTGRSAKEKDLQAKLCCRECGDDGSALPWHPLNSGLRRDIAGEDLRIVSSLLLAEEQAFSGFASSLIDEEDDASRRVANDFDLPL
nr:hypothetical protein Iba_chr14dCG5990 [Ipomoea batatas]